MAIGEHLRSNIDHHGLSDDLALGGFVSVGPEKKKVSRRKVMNLGLIGLYSMKTI